MSWLVVAEPDPESATETGGGEACIATKAGVLEGPGLFALHFSGIATRFLPT